MSDDKKFSRKEMSWEEFLRAAKKSEEGRRMTKAGLREFYDKLQDATKQIKEHYALSFEERQVLRRKMAKESEMERFGWTEEQWERQRNLRRDVVDADLHTPEEEEAFFGTDESNPRQDEE